MCYVWFSSLLPSLTLLLSFLSHRHTKSVPLSFYRSYHVPISHTHTTQSYHTVIPSQFTCHFIESSHVPMSNTTQSYHTVISHSHITYTSHIDITHSHTTHHTIISHSHTKSVHLSFHRVISRTHVTYHTVISYKFSIVSSIFILVTPHNHITQSYQV